ncbi:hypothetical protein LCGC14_0863860 [marine sediment metagenome]|uniref:LITAF domain-containing protein n=1 Tax=marine sediment metagenome TaxID=412755 RepID=A0A0F9PS22_9ZZZZ
MSVVQIQAACKYCGGPMLFTKQGTGHILHLLLSVVTVGLWLPVWLGCGVMNAFRPFRCVGCGKAKLR